MRIYSDLNSKVIKGCIDALIAGVGFFLAYQTRFEGEVPAAYEFQFWVFLPGIIVGRVASNALLKVYHRIWRYIGIVDATQIIRSYVVFSAILLILRIAVPGHLSLFRLPFSVITMDLMFTVLGTLSVRILRRVLYGQRNHSDRSSESPPRVLLLGAGMAGVLAAKELLLRSDRTVIAFLDDDPKKVGAVIAGLSVLGPIHQLGKVVRDYEIDEVVVCIDQAPQDVLKRIWRSCEGLEARILMVPSIHEMVDGKMQVSRLEQVSVEDLLAREVLEEAPNQAQLRAFYVGKRVLITGAGGSIGSELTRQLAKLGPDNLLLMDKDENGLYELHNDLSTQTQEPRYELLVGDVRDRNRIRNVFDRFCPEIVFHAAAHKHVPLMEMNPGEAIWNNVFGTENVLEQAIACGTSLFVLISTDKAVRPKSIMGASKRMGEMLVRSKSNQSRTRLACVRFGNVMGSRGSVIPLFKRQIASGGPITLTSPEVTRYFMTISEAVELVIQVGLVRGENGIVYVLDMGDPIRISDLARELIELSGLQPHRDIQIETIGLRAGEKLKEELVGDDEQVICTDHPKIIAIKPKCQLENSHFTEILERMRRVAGNNDAEQINRLFKALDFGFETLEDDPSRFSS